MLQGKKAAIIRRLRGLCGQVIGERYRLDELLAVSGMGAVFRSRHLQLDKDVAVKLLRPDLSNNREVCARLQREAKLSSRLDHPNCVRVFDFGTTAEGTRFLVMELLRGRDLTSLLRRPLPLVHVVEITAQILEGLEHAHRRGVLHRDVKPGNIRLVNDDDGRVVAKVCDFGIAKAVGTGATDTIITQIGTIFGTPVYMSPEQAAGHEIDHRADIYSVGVVMYEMLAGKPPFRDTDPVELLDAKIEGRIPPIADAPAPIVAVLQRMLAVLRKERFQSAAEAAVAVRAAGPKAGVVPEATPHEWASPLEEDVAEGLQVSGQEAGEELRSDTSIIRAFGAGLDKVLREPTPHAQARLHPGIHAAESPADDYIDVDNLQLEELGGRDGES
ncbi:MAG: serine/threonine protein kinase [Nannocystaceae bacterium]|nr:serine/threonine protein kinase [Nannocystaceae bacterium]